MNNEIKFYGNIGQGGIDPTGISDTISDFERKGAQGLTIRMHSYGGSVFDGNVIYNSIDQCKAKTKIIVEGIAASMAGIILLAADEVEIAENGFVMIHRPHSDGGGDSESLLQTAKLLKDMETEFARAWARKTGKSEQEFIANWLDGKDHWLNADEAIRHGFATRKIPAVARNVKSLDKSAVSALGAKNLYNRYAASLNTKNTIMKKELIDLMKLDGVTDESADAEVLQKAKEKFQKMEQLVKRSETQSDESITALVRDAIRAGKIPAAMTATYERVGRDSGITALSEILTNIRPPVPLASWIIPESKHHATPKNRSDWTLEDYRKHDPKALERNPKLFDELYKKQYDIK